MSKITYCLRPLERKDIDDAVIALLDRDAPMKRDNTGIIRNYYVCFVPQPLLNTVEKLWGFVPVKDYPHFINHAGLEFGIVGNARKCFLVFHVSLCEFVCYYNEKMSQKTSKKAFFNEFCVSL